MVMIGGVILRKRCKRVLHLAEIILIWLILGVSGVRPLRWMMGSRLTLGILLGIGVVTMSLRPALLREAFGCVRGVRINSRGLIIGGVRVWVRLMRPQVTRRFMVLVRRLFAFGR